MFGLHERSLAYQGKWNESRRVNTVPNNPKQEFSERVRDEEYADKTDLSEIERTYKIWKQQARFLLSLFMIINSNCNKSHAL